MSRPLEPLDCPLHGGQLIEASAGTGKTYTITTLYLRLVVERALRVEEILVVTFTRAATAELRDKLRARLRAAEVAFRALAEGKEARTTDPTIAEYAERRAAGGDAGRDLVRLQAALRDFDEAAVFTIHGFCQRVLLEQAFESGQTFDAELISDERPLLREICEDYWARWTYDAPEAFVAHLRSRKLDPDQLLKLAQLRARMPEARIRPDPPADAPAGPADPAAFVRERCGDAERERDAAHAMAGACWRADRGAILDLLCAEGGPLNRNAYRPDTIRATWAPALDATFAEEAAPRAAGLGFFERLTPEGLETRTKKGRERPRHPFFDACGDLRAAEDTLAETLDEAMRAMLRALPSWAEREADLRKRRWNKIAFGDLLGRLDHVLSGEDKDEGALARALRARYPAALIDEFQDTDPVQYRIFERLYLAPASREALALFLIGDPKQAIYGFRGADVFAYLRARKQLGDRGRWTLPRNYRSDPAMIHAVNQVFAQGEAPFALPGLTFAPVDPAPEARERLHDGGGDGAALQIRVLPPPEDAEDTGWSSKADAKREIRGRIAAEVARLLESGARLEEDNGSMRRLGPGDVAILVRSNKEAKATQRQLRRLGIPSALQSEASVLDTPDAESVERLVVAMAEPSHSGALRAALATPLLGVRAEDLDIMAHDEEAWESRAARFFDARDTWERRGFLPAFRRLLDAENVPRRLLERQDGERRLTNLLHLGELLHDAERTLDLGVLGLLRWLRSVRLPGRARDELVGEAGQLRLESDEAAVRVVTVHKAKGLEYPVVFCPELWERPRPEIHRHWILAHEDDRNVIELTGAEEGPLADAARREALSEDFRLLYVALTRARHRCVLVWGEIGTADADLPSALGVRLAAGSMAREEWTEANARAGRAPDAPSEADLAALVEASRVDGRPTISVGPLAPSRAERLAMDGVPSEDAPELEPRRLRRSVERDWRVTSYTALARRPEEDEVVDLDAAPPMADADALSRVPGRDRDEGATAAASQAGMQASAQAPERDAPRVPLADFPAGPQAGQVLHDILERTRFGAASGGWSLEAVTQRELRRQGFDEAAWAEPLATALRHALATPLHAGPDAPRLGDLRAEDRRAEWEFMLPMARGKTAFGPADLAAAFAADPDGLPAGYAQRLARLRFGPTRGFLHGYVDLLFRHRGRWYLADYKSNRLGSALSDYALAGLDAEMTRHDYILQYHLYIVAALRQLRRFQPDFSYDRDFGGAAYLFLRAATEEPAPGQGVYFDRPPAARIHALAAHFEVPA